MTAPHIDLVDDDQVPAAGDLVDLGLLRRLGHIAQLRLGELADDGPDEALDDGAFTALDAGQLVSLMSKGLPESYAAELSALVPGLQGPQSARVVRARLGAFLGWGLGLLDSVKTTPSGRQLPAGTPVPPQLAEALAAARTAAARTADEGAGESATGQYL